MTYVQYINYYGEMPERDFNRISWEAERYVDNVTKTVDGFSKLKGARPTDDEPIVRCICKLINTMYSVEQEANKIGYIEREDGTILPKTIASISAGGESISYKADTSDVTLAAKSQQDRNVLYYSIVKDYLSGVCDKNGVPMLYSGVYPYVQ